MASIHVAKEGLKHQTIKSYLAAVRHIQIVAGFLSCTICHCLNMLRGVKSEQAKNPTLSQRTRLLITPVTLRKVRCDLEKDKTNYNCVMLWAAYCTAFFEFLSSGEVTVPSLAAYDPGAHLSYGDIKFNSQTHPTLAQVDIKASKKDPFRAGVLIYLGRTNCNLCPVAALVAYMYHAIRGSGAGPFFRFREGTPLSREKMVERLREHLAEVGVDSTISGHNFRIGAMTTASERGIQD